MRTIIEKLFKKAMTEAKNNFRRMERILHDAATPKYISLKDHKNHQMTAKLLDLSMDGCRVVVSNAHLFVGSELTLFLNPEEAKLAGAIRQQAKVIWSDMHKIDQSRYCTVGLQFVKSEVLEHFLVHQERASVIATPEFYPTPRKLSSEPLNLHGS